MAPASAHCASLVQTPGPGPPLLPPPKLHEPGGGVVEHCASFGRWLTGTRPPPELLEDPPPLLELPPEDPLPPLLLLEAPPLEEVEPPLLDPPPELEELLLPSVPPSPGVTKTLPPHAQRDVSEATKASARRMIDPPSRR